MGLLDSEGGGAKIFGCKKRGLKKKVLTSDPGGWAPKFICPRGPPWSNLMTVIDNLSGHLLCAIF